MQVKFQVSLAIQICDEAQRLRAQNSGKGWVIQHLDLGSTRTCQDSGVIIAL